MKRPSPNYVAADAKTYYYVLAKKGKMTEAEARAACAGIKDPWPASKAGKRLECQQFDNFDAFAFAKEGVKRGSRPVGLVRYVFLDFYGREISDISEIVSLRDGVYFTDLSKDYSAPTPSNRGKGLCEKRYERAVDEAHAATWFKFALGQIVREWERDVMAVFKNGKAVPASVAFAGTGYSIRLVDVPMNFDDGDNIVLDHKIWEVWRDGVCLGRHHFMGNATSAALAAAQAEGLLMDYKPFKHSK